jgi:hypothetical protein
MAEIVAELNTAIQKGIINRKIEDPVSDVAELETTLRGFLRRKLSGYTTDKLAELKLSTGESVLASLAKNQMLPDELKVSVRIRQQSNLTDNLGTLSILPKEIFHGIIKLLTIEEASLIITVSRSWLKEILDQIWASEDESSSPTHYLAAIKRFLYARYLKRRFYCFGEEVDVVDGEGLLEHDSGSLHGLKLNGKPIIAWWDDGTGSVCRFIARSKVLTRDEISHITKSIETYLNASKLDLSILSEKLTPFLKCMKSGTYRVSVERTDQYKSVVHYQSNYGFPMLDTYYADHMYIHCTQPKDKLDPVRIRYYEEQLKRGARPAMLALNLHVRELFLLDGHHKIEAYANLGLTKEMLFVNIEPINFPETEREQELVYVNQSPQALLGYNRATNYL